MSTYTPEQISAARTRMTTLVAALADVPNPGQQQRVTAMQAALDVGDAGVSAYIDAHPDFAHLA